MTREEVDAVVDDVLRANTFLISTTGCAAQRIKLTDEIGLDIVYVAYSDGQQIRLGNEIYIHPDAWEQIRKEYPLCGAEEWTEGDMLWGIPVITEDD